VRWLLRVSREPLSTLGATPPPPEVLARLEQISGEVRRGFLQHELKSYEVMQRTLAGAAPA
jgi:hypothetical protein